MIYADTDFFIALAKENDWLKDRALTILKQYRGKIITSTVTIIELLLISKRFSIDQEELISAVYQIVTAVEGINEATALAAAHLIKEDGFHVFDALHAAYCGTNSIISSDHIFESVGLERIRLEK